MKTCRTCKQDKPSIEFRNHAKMADGLSTQCRDCAREISKKRWREKPEWRAKILAHNAAQRVKLIEYVGNHLLAHPCVDCGETDPLVLDYDHVRGEKKYNIAQILQRGMSVATLVAEIEKCEVRCSNCHRRQTARRHGGWWKLALIPIGTVESV